VRADNNDAARSAPLFAKLEKAFVTICARDPIVMLSLYFRKHLYL
jgi:hypothetical protein